jgi:hypothetical protein
MISATVEEVFSGSWVADTVDIAPPTGAFNLAGSDWAGAVLDQSKDGGRYYARIVGGAGKLATQLADRWYNGTALADTIAADMVAEAGETLGTSALGTSADSWQRKAGTLGECLSQLVATLGGIWWVGRDGKVNLGPSRAGSDIPVTTVTVSSTDVDGSLVVSPNAGLDGITPGAQWQGKIVKHVRWSLTPGNLSAALAFHELPSPPLTFDYFRTYSAKVDAQNGDGSLNVIVDAKFAVSNVKWLSGVPAKVTINGGDSITLGWLGGDPRYPYTMGLAMTDGTKAAAGKGDTVDIGYLVCPILGAGTGSVVIPPTLYFPPGPEGQAAANLAGVPPQYNAPIALTGLITSGLDRVKW